MALYINSASSYHAELDFKTLIPDANMRRRMSYVVKMGVGTAMDCIGRASVERIDAIITATGLGCLADSEKFLKSIQDNNEQLLNPTPFIQSTFNTIGGQVALLTKSHCYNMTYSHRFSSFESALLDALMMAEEGGAEHILVGAADEKTPTQLKIMERLGAYRNGNTPDEGAYFFMLGLAPATECLGVIEGLYLAGQAPVGEFDITINAGKSYHTASAAAMFKATEAIKDGAKRVLVVNDEFKIALRCM
ncbi:beta-ketoacyl synthase chain length factor [Alistipes sp. ZOR0009]|uniref:beta-ketoacyl synthase chain length factor n=1 Tax=Alistipes sp. ZOR0009 TaxID=1339253 RepID=UPI00068E7008|nr:beta-ketoacyl synthase chain length factor [Alistipes sp. ZOR0009]